MPDIRAQVGQLFMLAFDGTDSEVIRPLISERGVGALYLSNENLTEPGKTAELLNELHRMGIEGRANRALISAADQEGAWGVMVPYSCVGPGNMALGGAPVGHTEAMYGVYGKELSAVGVFADLAPAADVNSNPGNPIIGTRSFGEYPQRVAERVSAAIRGLHQSQVMATAKHFPGHGNTATDSHRGIPRVSRSPDDIRSIDLFPFRVAIRSGVDMVMTSHIIFDALDPVNPATLSKPILVDLLRGQMGFEGVVISDSFNMNSIRKSFSPPDAAVAAILAGVDLIMLAEERYGDEVGDYVSSQYAILDRVEKAVETGEIPMARFEEAFGRVQALKDKYSLEARVPVDVTQARQTVGSPPHREVELEAARAALRVLFDPRGFIPLKSGQQVGVVSLVKPEARQEVREGRGIGPNYADGFSAFVSALKNLGVSTTEGFGSGQALVVVSENYPLAGRSFDTASQHEALEQLRRTHTGPMVHVALRDPYQALSMSADACLCAFGSGYSNAVAAAEGLAGKIKLSSDMLPVTPQ